VLERESRTGGVRVALGADGWLAADWPR
jgi:hypothetical protein